MTRRRNIYRDNKDVVVDMGKENYGATIGIGVVGYYLW